MKLATHWRPLLVLALFLGLSLLIFARSPIVRAVDANDPPPDYQITETEMEDYWNATKDCSTPSLECLVRNVSRFTAIEWSLDIVGKDGPPCKIGGTCTNDVGGQSTVADGAIGSLSNLITSMYANPVASSQTYIADVMRSAHIVPPAYAQGLGFASLDPILNLWKTFRNIAYMFFVLIFVVIGFMIMFRQKIGQTAITAQQAIPQIIMSLVLVTFSFAIAGFIIDLMYVVMVLIVGVFSSFFPQQDVFGYNILELAGELFRGAVNMGRNKDFISGFLDGLNVGGAANQVVSIVGGLTLTLVLAIAMLIGVIRLFFELLKSYATVVIAVVMAPLLLMLGAIPGRSSAVGTWLKTLIGNLSPFPVVLVVLVMYYAFSSGAVNASSGGFMPPFLLSAGSGIGDSIIALMSLAIILSLPDIVKHIKDGIAPKNALAELITRRGLENLKSGFNLGAKPVGGAIGAGIGAGRGLTKGVWDTDWQGGLSRAKLYNIATQTGRSAGQGMAGGVKVVGNIGSSIGAKTPGSLSFVEKAVDSGSTHFTEKSILDRIANRKNWLGRSTAGRKQDTWQAKKELAERQAEKKAWEESRLRSGQFWTPTESDKP